MKKILKLSIALLIISIIMIGNVFAMECNTSIKLPKTEFEENEEFKVDFCISDIKSNRGAISLQGTLEYDKDSLTLIRMEGKNGWETPTDGASYNKANGKFAIVRSGAGKSDEVILSITFKVKEQAKQNPSISLKDVAIADGDGMAKFANISKTITIKSKNSDTETDETDTELTPDNSITDKSDTNELNNNDEGQDQTTSNGNLPQTGNTINFGFMIILIFAILICTYSLIKIKGNKK